MDTATFFEKFSLFAQAEDAATRFREVVLNLAFSGKLKGTDLSGWETHPIGDFFTEGLKSINAPESPNQTYELWSVPSFETGAPEIVTGAQVGSTKRELRDGTILLGKINPHLNRIWVVNRRTNHPMIASQEWINVTAGDKWDTGYLARLLSSPSFNRSVCATAQGMGSLTRANTKQVAQIVVHCPPLKEQQKLIAKVDELMALCDRLEAQLKERDVKQVALAKAALAKFTEDPTTENLQLLFHPSFSIEPEELRGAIITIATQGGLTTRDRNDKPVQTTSTTKPPFEIPSNWRWKTLKEIGLCRTGKTPPTNDSANYGPGFPFIGPGQITPNGKIIEPEKYITREGLEYSTDASEGDILMVCIGGSIGKTAICLNPIGFNQQINSVRPYQDLAQYVYLAIKANYFKKQVLDGATGSATPIINKSRWEQIPIPIPPLAEQKRIVEKVESYMMLIEQLKSQLEASRNTGEKLLEAMVAELTSA